MTHSWAQQSGDGDERGNQHDDREFGYIGEAAPAARAIAAADDTQGEVASLATPPPISLLPSTLSSAAGATIPTDGEISRPGSKPVQPGREIGSIGPMPPEPSLDASSSHTLGLGTVTPPTPPQPPARRSSDIQPDTFPPLNLAVLPGSSVLSPNNPSPPGVVVQPHYQPAQASAAHLRPTRRPTSAGAGAQGVGTVGVQDRDRRRQQQTWIQQQRSLSEGHGNRPASSSSSGMGAFVGGFAAAALAPTSTPMPIPYPFRGGDREFYEKRMLSLAMSAPLPPLPPLPPVTATSDTTAAGHPHSHVGAFDVPVLDPAPGLSSSAGVGLLGGSGTGGERPVLLPGNRTHTMHSSGESKSNVDWIVPVDHKGMLSRRSVAERLQPTLDTAKQELEKYKSIAKRTGYALNIAIGLQVVIGALTTGVSAATIGRQTSIATAILGGFSTMAASYLARARGSNEPEFSISRAKDLEQYIRECESFVMDNGHVVGVELDIVVYKLRERFEELLGNDTGNPANLPPPSSRVGDQKLLSA